MRSLLLAVAAAAAGGPAAAQPNTFPLHLQLLEGDGVDTTLLGQPAYIRWQQIDSDSATFYQMVRSLRLRRDHAAAAPLATAQTVDIELAFGFNQLSAFTNDFASNWLYLGFANTKLVVIPRTSISLPDWTQIPNIRPTPFDVTLNVGFYTHRAFASFLWELQVWSNGAPTHPLDATSVNGTFHSSLARTGAGCGAFTTNASFDVSNWRATSALTLSIAGAPARHAIYGLLGTIDPNWALPFLCAPLHVDLTLPAVPIGMASSVGTASLTIPTGPHYPFSQLFTFYAQAVAVPSLALSDGVTVVMPIAPAPFDVQHTWTTNPSATTGAGPVTGGVVALFG